jgi:hypothetical protein
MAVMLALLVYLFWFVVLGYVLHQTQLVVHVSIDLPVE